VIHRLLAVLALTGTAVLTPAAGAGAPSSPPPVTPPAGSIGVRLLDAPTTESADPRARLYIIDHLDLGAVIHRRIQVVNTTERPAQLTVYPDAATITDGTFTAAPGHTPNELTGWIGTDPAALSVPAASTAQVTVTITVPPDASPGERYAVVFAEASSAPPSSGGVGETNRVGIRAYLSVGPGGPPAADFTIDALTAHRTPDGHPLVTAQVHNTGGRALDMTGTLTLTGGPGGLTAGPFPVALGTTLAPGDTAPVTATLDPQLPNGPWTATLTLTSGLIQHTTQATLQFPPPGGAPVAASSAAPADPTPLTTLLTLTLAAAVLLAVLLYLHRRRRAAIHSAPTPQED
jgi:hypothetical protein